MEWLSDVMVLCGVISVVILVWCGVITGVILVWCCGDVVVSGVSTAALKAV